MRIVFKTISDSLIIKLFGELDHHCSEQIRKKIDNEILNKNPSNIIFDMENLNFMDSSGIGVIIGRYKLLSSKGGKVIIVNQKPQVKRLYEICGLKRIIPEYEDTRTAIKTLKERN